MAGAVPENRGRREQRPGILERRRVRRILLWALAALPILALLTFALPVAEWRTGQRAAEPLPLLRGGPPVARPRRIWIDTDSACGHATDADADDCFALLILLRAEGIELAGISAASGNAPAEASARIAGEIAALMPTAAPPIHRGALAQAALRSALAEEPLTIVALGPLTNVAAALRARPDLAGRVERLIGVMRRRPGHIFHPAEGRGDGILFGHGPVFRDFNFDLDRDSASAVLALGVPITLIPYEAARDVTLRGTDLDRLAGASRAASWVAERARPWLGFWKRVVGLDGFYPFDALAAAYVLDPTLFDCATVSAWIARDRRLWGGWFGPEALLVGVERERAKHPRASGTVIYCPRTSPTMHDWLMARLTAG